MEGHPNLNKDMIKSKQEAPDMLKIDNSILESKIDYLLSHNRRSNNNSSKITPHMHPESVEINPLQIRTSQLGKNNIDILSPWNLADFNPFQPLILPKHPKVQDLVIDIDKIQNQDVQSTAKTQ